MEVYKTFAVEAARSLPHLPDDHPCKRIHGHSFKITITVNGQINEDTGFVLSIKTLIAIGFAMATLISMWFMLQADIAEAKELPIIPPDEVTRMEFNMKDQMIRNTIMETQNDVKEIKESIEKIEDKLYNR